MPRSSPTTWEHRLRTASRRLTRPRRLIVDALGSTADHLSAEEVYRLVHRTYPRIGLTTVYRTLDVLEEMGIVSRLDVGDDRSRYELTENPRKAAHHHHLVCSGCKRILEYEDFIDEEVKLIRKLERELSRKHGFLITGHIIQFLGLCPGCSKVRKAATT